MTDLATLESLRKDTAEHIEEMERERDELNKEIKEAKDELAKIKRDIELKKTEGAP